MKIQLAYQVCVLKKQRFVFENPWFTARHEHTELYIYGTVVIAVYVMTELQFICEII